MFGRYAGYTQGSSEYSVKSLTEREAAKLLSSCPSSAAVQRLYSPCHTNNHPDLNSANAGTVYANSYQRYSVPECSPIPETQLNLSNLISREWWRI